MSKPANTNALAEVVDQLDHKPITAEPEGTDASTDGDDLNKALPTEDDLLKALGALTASAKAVESGVSLRETDLAAKLAAGEELSKSEKDELRKSLGDEPAAEAPSNTADAMAADPTIAEGMEVSPFLEKMTTELCKSIDGVKEASAKGFSEQGTFNAVLAKSLAAIGGHMVALQKRIGELEANVSTSVEGIASQPVAPKGSTRVGQPAGENLAKSQTAGDEELPSLTKAQIFDTLDELCKSDGGMHDGIDFVYETTKFESVEQLSPQAMRVVLKKRNIDPAKFGL